VTADSVSWQWYNGAIDADDLEENAIEDAREGGGLVPQTQVQVRGSRIS
jgi:hypothetical protein